MAAEFNTDAVTPGWITSACIISAALFIFSFGRFTDNVGIKKFYLLAFLIFTCLCVPGIRSSFVRGTIHITNPVIDINHGKCGERWIKYVCRIITRGGLWPFFAVPRYNNGAAPRSLPEKNPFSYLYGGVFPSVLQYVPLQCNPQPPGRPAL